VAATDEEVVVVGGGKRQKVLSPKFLDWNFNTAHMIKFSHSLIIP